ncbi:MAG: efflux RND transporter permease subunit, partial [Planctomycetota bacterium]
MEALFNALIAGSLRNRWLVIFAAILLLIASLFVAASMPVDVFPELQAPTVTIMTEASGFAAEEVELAVSFPIETAVNGLPGIRRVRSTSANGLSIVFAEFGFDTDIYRARQLVSERLDQAKESLPENVDHSEMAPISSVTGEIMLLALASPDGAISPLELRRVAEFDLRTRLLAVSGVAQVTALGGQMPEYQVLVRPDDLQRYGITLEEVATAAGAAHAPAGGGYLPDVDGNEFPLRLGTRVRSAADIAGTVVGEWRGAPLTLDRVADIGLGPAPTRGTGALNGRDAVILTIKKNPGINTLNLTADIDAALDEFERGMPAGMALERKVYRQADFIDVAIGNVESAVMEGALFVLIIVVLFLMNLRTTFITLTALPLSLGGALVVLHWWGATINVMTLGGLAVAIGSLVDDAIVDVENCFRRLRENHEKPPAERHPFVYIVYISSVEVRRAILLATAVIVLVFVPLFFLGGIEGRFFRPLGLAYMVSLGVSLIVAMTWSPVMCYLLLGGSKVVERPEGRFVNWLKGHYGRVLGFCLRNRATVLGASGGMIAIAIFVGSTFGSSFLPEFNEGTITVFLEAPPSTSLVESDRVARNVERQISALEGVAAITRRTGRAENDAHAHAVTTSEMDVRVALDADIDEVRARIRT